jgi:hypothetical protein
MIRNLFIAALIVLAAFSRLIPHPLNFAPITALALFSAVYMQKKYAFILPIAAMLLSDWIIGFASVFEIVSVYGSFLLIAGLGLWLRGHKSALNVALSSVAGSIIFFVVTNFACWLGMTDTYTPNFSGMVACYGAALPFFRNTLAGDMLYVAVMFGVYELCARYIPALRQEPVRATA